jgi:pyruvate/2-oxoglutarate dehydrogenase complex dihydrolipoamide acyltransferase (E2) component
VRRAWEEQLRGQVEQDAQARAEMEAQRQEAVRACVPASVRMRLVGWYWLLVGGCCVGGSPVCRFVYPIPRDETSLSTPLHSPHSTLNTHIFSLPPTHPPTHTLKKTQVRRAIESERHLLEAERQRAALREQAAREAARAQQLAREREAAERQAAWEAYRREERRRQQEEWARRQAGMDARRRRVERGLGLEDLLGGGGGGIGGIGGPVEEEEAVAAYPYESAAGAQRGWGGDAMVEEEENEEEAEAQALLPQESRAAIPFMITRDMRRTLIEDMNYSRKVGGGSRMHGVGCAGLVLVGG